MGAKASAAGTGSEEIPGLDPAAVVPPKGSTVMVTGANRGIGLALVKEYVSMGYKVLGTTRNPDKSEELKAALEGNEGFMVKCDIMNQESVDAAFAFVKDKGVTHIDVLFNNAGGGTRNHPHDKALDMETSEMARVFEMNVIGTFRMIRAFLPLVQKAKDGGRILNMSSDLASLENNRHGNDIGQKAGDKSSYRLTKASINMMTRTFAAEVEGPIFCAISPGWVDTRMGSAGGRKPPLSPEQSARLCASYGNRVGPKDNGRFISVSQEKGYIAF